MDEEEPVVDEYVIELTPDKSIVEGLNETIYSLLISTSITYQDVYLASLPVNEGDCETQLLLDCGTISL